MHKFNTKMNKMHRKLNEKPCISLAFDRKLGKIASGCKKRTGGARENLCRLYIVFSCALVYKYYIAKSIA